MPTKKQLTLSEKLIAFLVKETGGTENSPVPDEIYDAIGAVMVAFIMCSEEPISQAQEICGAIQCEVTARLMGEADEEPEQRGN